MASRNRRRQPPPARPSWFFLLALLLGLILLIWGASVALRKQTSFRTPPAKSAAIVAELLDVRYLHLTPVSGPRD